MSTKPITVAATPLLSQARASKVPARTASPLFRAYLLESWYEVLKLARAKGFTFAMVAFPLAFFALFGISNRAQMFHGYSLERYLLASYACFGCMGAAFFGVGASVAYERGHGWLDLKQVSPMPTGAYLAAKFFSSLVLGLLIVTLLLLLGAATVPLHLTVGQVLGLYAVNGFGVVVFGTIGLFMGLLMPPGAAAGLINFVYLPLSLCAGLWMPLEVLPHWMQRFAHYLPSYYCSRIALHTLGYFNDNTLPGYGVMLGYAIVFTVLCAVVFRRQASLR